VVGGMLACLTVRRSMPSMAWHTSPPSLAPSRHYPHCHHHCPPKLRLTPACALVCRPSWLQLHRRGKQGKRGKRVSGDTRRRSCQLTPEACPACDVITTCQRACRQPAELLCHKHDRV